MPFSRTCLCSDWGDVPHGAGLHTVSQSAMDLHPECRDNAVNSWPAVLAREAMRLDPSLEGTGPRSVERVLEQADPCAQEPLPLLLAALFEEELRRRAGKTPAPTLLAHGLGRPGPTPAPGPPGPGQHSGPLGSHGRGG